MFYIHSMHTHKEEAMAGVMESAESAVQTGS